MGAFITRRSLRERILGKKRIQALLSYLHGNATAKQQVYVESAITTNRLKNRNKDEYEFTREDVLAQYEQTKIHEKNL